MFAPDREVLSFRMIAILPIVLFTPTLILGVALPGSKIGAASECCFTSQCSLSSAECPPPRGPEQQGSHGWLSTSPAAR